MTRLPSAKPHLHAAGPAPASAVQPGCIPQHPLLLHTSENRVQMTPTTSRDAPSKPADRLIHFLSPSPPLTAATRDHLGSID